ncbi:MULTISPECIES: hypothetical protein [unclassified Lentimonas]|uniref:hypothetical protein n=1 Tax=unclassified Lentimonas TaxID=2630993 RepID=UPI00138983EE|nr:MULTISPECIES: hypothetical protein [unclassified Lentimonas]
MYYSRKKKSNSATSQDGFALVIALSLMAFILLLLLSITTLVQVETRSANTSKIQMEAEQAALLSLNIAIGELQKTAGPDQRITAAASIFGDSNNGHTSENPDGSSTTASSVTPAAGESGQDSWVGVWQSDTVAVGTPSYSPATPDQRKFLGWLVSSVNDTTGEFELPQKLDAVGVDVSTSSSYVTLATDSNDDAYMQVEKVPVADSDIAFAFAIEDESLKADLSWSELPKSSTTAERYQASRLSAAPGPDYGALNGSGATGPFDSISYPLSSDSGYLISKGILKIGDVAGVTNSMAGGGADDWLKDQRGNVTWGSRGVIADVKFGGLRRDLSLAFEMDGDAEAANATKFNDSVTSEFVGNGDRLSAPLKPVGLPIEERFLWRDYLGSGTTFNSHIKVPTGTVAPNAALPAVMRGPNWWALRDYANLYKRLSGSSGNYAMQARPYYPNRSTEDETYSDMFDIIRRGDGWDMETRFRLQAPDQGDEKYLYRPAQSNYAPVYLGATVLISLSGEDAGGNVDLVIGADPLFYFWNPYNRTIKVDHIGVRLGEAFPSSVALWLDPNPLPADSDGYVQYPYGASLNDLFKNNVTNKNGNVITYLIKDTSGGSITLEPGEVVIASPSDVPGAAKLGYETNDTSGILMSNLRGTNRISMPKVDPDTGNASTVGFNFLDSGGGDRHDVDISIPAAGISAADLYADLENFGEETQSWHMPMWAGDRSIAEYTTPEAVTDKETFDFDTVDADGNPVQVKKTRILNDPIATVGVSTLIGVKTYFGLHTLLMKPAAFTGQLPNPIEAFSLFNPMPMLMKRDYWRNCNLNMVYNHVTASNASTLLSGNGIGFSSEERNAFFGYSYEYTGAGTGSSFVTVSNIPESPLLSIAQFSQANLSIMSTDPLHAVGNSWASPVMAPDAPYGQLQTPTWVTTAQDFSWLINDALFDRYYFSGLAPDYEITGSGYSASASLEDTLSQFYGSDYLSAMANPVLRPYIPDGVDASQVEDELAQADGYKKFGAYALIQGAFNVNSTSVAAWKAFLGGNRDLEISYADGGDNSDSGSPFPKSSAPSAPRSGTESEWAGFARLSEDQIEALAGSIVDQVKLRGPFMSLSDFVNRRVGPLNDDTSYMGAIQAAINIQEAAGLINTGAKGAAFGTTPVYTQGDFYAGAGDVGTRTTTTGIATSVTQADVLTPLAPRMTVRADTFKVRAYGEVRSTDGDEIQAKAVCEVVVQRLPEFVDDADNPWDEATDPLAPSVSALSSINERFGRKFKIVQFRWLSSDEI